MSSLLRASAIIALSIIAPLSGAPAHAQEVDSAEQRAAARQLFREGVRLGQRDEWVEAADRFERAYALRPSPPIGFNLAAALEKIGALVRASELLRQLGNQDDAPRQVQRAAGRLLAEIEPRIAQLTLSVTGDTEGATLTLDDEPVAEATVGVAVPSDPGPHRVSLVRDEVEVDSRDFELAEGASEAVELHAPPRPPPPEDAARTIVQPPPPPVVDPDDGGIVTEWWFWTAIGVVVVAAVATVLVVALSGDPDPIGGNGSPPVLTIGGGG